MKRFLAIASSLFVLLGAVLVGKALTLPSKQPSAQELVLHPVDSEAAAQRLAGGLALPTISLLPPAPTHREVFLELHSYLEEAYPLVHRVLTRETVSELSLLYTWQGSDHQSAPIVLMAHQDVVPVSPGTETEWQHPPFAGVVQDNYVWGRGAMDDKGNLFSILEAVESLLAEDFQPDHTIYLAFGHDEEVGGANGARVIAEVLEERGIDEFAFVLDEGSAVASGFIPGVEPPVALIGIAEKGYVSLELRVTGDGGHSSAPPETTNIGRLAKAIALLEADPFPADLQGTARQTFEYLAPELPFLPRLLFANLWLFEPLVVRQLVASSVTAAMLRTTTAATIFEAGVKDNVLPIQARAVVNFRIRPGETVEGVRARVSEIVDDKHVEIAPVDEKWVQEASPESDPTSAAFSLVAESLLRVTSGPTPLISPYLVIGGTDAKYYAGRSRNVYRFSAMLATRDDFKRVHGSDERISIENLVTMIRFYRELIRASDSL